MTLVQMGRVFVFRAIFSCYFETKYGQHSSQEHELFNDDVMDVSAGLCG
jgi:hypothetical protein